MKVLEHLTDEAIERYRERRSSAAETLAVQNHVGTCARCRARLESAVAADAAFLNLRGQMASDASDFGDDTHLPYEHLALYLDGKLDEVEREIADSHLSICQSCTDDLADLRRYQVIAADAGPTTSQATALPSNGTSLPRRAARWRRFFIFDFRQASGALVSAGMAAAIVGVVLLGLWLATRPNAGDDSGEVAKIEPTKPTADVPTPEPGVQSTSSAPTENLNPPNTETAPPQASQPTLRPTQPPPTAATTPRPASNASPPTFTLNDGDTQIALDSSGRLSGLESLPAPVQQAVRRSISAQRAQTPRALDSLSGGSSVLMGGPAASADNGVPIALVTPVGRVVRGERPILRWRPLPGATGYTVAVVDANFRVVAQSPSITASEWAVDQPLPRGANYSWQVKATTADGAEIVSPTSPAPQAKFRVLDQSALDEVTRVENSRVRSHLARGVAYAGAGLLDEAATEFEALVEANPRSQLARRLLNSVRR